MLLFYITLLWAKNYTASLTFQQSVKYGEREKFVFLFEQSEVLLLFTGNNNIEIKRLQKMLFYIGLLTNLYVKINSV